MAEGSRIVPADHQPALPMDRLIVSEPPGEESVEMDVVFVVGVGRRAFLIGPLIAASRGSPLMTRVACRTVVTSKNINR